jgi:hypothetical protein
MPQYVHVGHTATREGVFDLTKFGQTVNLPDEVADQAVLDGVSLLTPEEFSACGFTPDELSRWALPETHRDDVIDPAFFAKKKQAWLAVHAKREHLKSLAVNEASHGA